ncbi:MAG: ATP-binding cassette domain-containing protein [Actinomycetota bacterium]|nr:ATP-binding cassette domain-containing protein [Actinomycetota bacterium]
MAKAAVQARALDAVGGICLDAYRLTRTAAGRRILSDVSLRIHPGEIVAVVGGSGAGKSTLVETLAGVNPPDRGRVLLGRTDLYDNLESVRPWVGYVPQEDIIHMDLPLERTLRYAAALRMPPASSEGEIAAAVEASLAALDLMERRDTPVAALSGGQRKRASIAVELLTRPRVFFLDEPTSGLDPATSAGLLRVLVGLAQAGTTVIFTTHAVQDLSYCDRVLFLAPGGRLAFAGSVGEALQHFGVERVEQVYERLLDPAITAVAASLEPPPSTGRLVPTPDTAARPGPLRQLRTLTARTAEALTRNKLTLAILLGSPAMIVALFVILFRPDAFAFSDPQPTAILMILFWITFGAFFFGLTYGLLQIVVERPILRRERLAGLKLSSYLVSKIAVMLPFLAAVNITMLFVLRLLDRLPSASLATYASVAFTLILTSLAALMLGLLASAAADNPSQATLTLPMLCFPAVLFSGAILPVNIMATVGRWIAAVVPSRWAFEAVGHDLGIRQLMAEGGSPLGPPLLETFGSAGQRATTTYWAILGAFALLFFIGAWAVLVRNSARSPRAAR